MARVFTLRKHGAFVASAVILATTYGGAAHADASRPSGTRKPDASQAPTSDELADQAFKAYEVNDFATAVELYLKAFQISGDVRILYNVASIYDKKLQNAKLAEEFYLRYLKSKGTEPELLKKASDRLLGMKDERDSPSEKAESVSAEPASPPSTAQPSQRTIGVVIAGAGVVAIGVGVAFGVSALSQADDLHTQCPNDICPNAEGPTLRDDASSAATLATVFILGGVALAGAGAVAFFLAPHEARSTGLRVRPTVDRARAGLALAWTF
jgi:hypothetical protein